MTQEVYALPDEVHAILARARAECIARVNGTTKSGLALLEVPWTRDRAMAAYREVVREVCGRYMQPVDPDRLITVECHACKERARVRGNVIEFRCRCSPDKLQFTYLQRVINGVDQRSAPIFYEETPENGSAEDDS